MITNEQFVAVERAVAEVLDEPDNWVALACDLLATRLNTPVTAELRAEVQKVVDENAPWRDDDEQDQHDYPDAD